MNKSPEEGSGLREATENKLSGADRERFLELRDAFTAIIKNSSTKEILNHPDLKDITKGLKKLIKKAEQPNDK